MEVRVLWFMLACGGSNILGDGSVVSTMTAVEDPAPDGTFTLDGSTQDALDEGNAWEDSGTLCDGAPTQSAGWVLDNRADAWPAYVVRACGPISLDGDYVSDGELDVYLRLTAPPAEGETRTFTEAGAELSWEIQVPDEAGENAEWGGKIDLPSAGLTELLAESVVTVNQDGTGSLELPEVPWEWRENCASAVQDCKGLVELNLSWEMQ